jgi:hypothetical protein
MRQAEMAPPVARGRVAAPDSRAKDPHETILTCAPGIRLSRLFVVQADGARVMPPAGPWVGGSASRYHKLSLTEVADVRPLTTDCDRSSSSDDGRYERR